eukprot:PhF_6_TR33795/c0_g1_i1/m.49565
MADKNFDDYWYMRMPPPVLNVHRDKSASAPPAPTTTMASTAVPPQNADGTYFVATGVEDAMAIKTLKDHLAHAMKGLDEARTAAKLNDNARLVAEGKQKEQEMMFVVRKAQCAEQVRVASYARDHAIYCMKESGERCDVEKAEINSWQGIALQFVSGLKSLLIHERNAALTARSNAELVLKELKQQMSQNTIVLQQHANTIRSLSHEVIQAKQQTAAIAAGYHKTDTEYKSTLALTKTQVEKIKTLEEAQKKMKAVVTDTSANEATIKSLTQQVKDRDNEILTLRTQLTQCQADLQGYRKEIDRARNYANDALRASEQYERPTKGGRGIDAMDSIRKEFMEEKRRVDKLLHSE